MNSRSNNASRRKLPRWLPEIVLVVVSVTLGFGASEYGRYRGDRQLQSAVLEGLSAEIEHNFAVLEPMVPFHAAWVRALSETKPASTQSGLDVWFATRPNIPKPPGTPFATLRRSAWDAAVAGGSLRLMDYDLTAALSELYRAQDVLTENVNRLASGALSQTATFDPASRDASVRLLWLTLADIYAAEEIVLRLYRDHGSLVRKAALRSTISR